MRYWPKETKRVREERYSRSGLNTHRTHFIVAPTHGLKRRVIVTQLSFASQKVFLFIDGHSALPVVLFRVISHTPSVTETHLTTKIQITDLTDLSGFYNELKTIH